MSLPEDKLAVIQQQLGREPRGIVAIAAESNKGVPLVLQMRSVVDGKPFPTLYWLSSKTLHKAIAHIETEGFVKEVEQRVQDDAGFRAAFLANQQAYVDRRTAAMLPEDRAHLERINLLDTFNAYGIGGIAQWDKVRCLHMQYAHHLADANVVGALLDEIYQLNTLDITL